MKGIYSSARARIRTQIVQRSLHHEYRAGRMNLDDISFAIGAGRKLVADVMENDLGVKLNRPGNPKKSREVTLS